MKKVWELKPENHKKNSETFFFTACLFYFCTYIKNQNEKWEERLNSEKEEK